MNDEKTNKIMSSEELDDVPPKYEPIKLSGKNLAQNYVSAFNTGMNIYQCVNYLQGNIDWTIKAVNDVVKSWNNEVSESIDQSKAIVRETTTEQFNTEWNKKQPELITQVNTLTTNQFNNEKSVFNDELDTLNARMDSFTSLSEGSTTGDAELKDIRVGANGVTYPNAGDAVRGQYSQLNKNLVNQKKEIDGLKLIVKKDGPITDMTWSKVQQIVANGSGSDAFEIGAQIIEKWTDTADSKEYDMPWQVNHFEDITLEDGEVVPGMWLQSHYTLPFGIQLSHQRAFLACPDGLSTGTYNFDFAKAWGNNVKPGINYQFTLTKPVEKGGRLAGCYGAPDQAPSNWKVYSYGKDGITLNETVNVTVGNGGTNIGTIQYDSRSGNLNSTQEMAHGWNRWKTSALRQWLNSSKPKGQWWTPQDKWDICPDQLASKDGFLCGMPDEMINCLKKVKVVTYANTVNDEGAEDITYDYVTLPSLSQMFIKPQTSGEGDVHTYWKRRSGRTTPCEWWTDYPNMVEYSIANKTLPQYARLRSADRGNACHAWYVNASGGVSNGYGASSAITFAPLVCIA